MRTLPMGMPLIPLFNGDLMAGQPLRGGPGDGILFIEFVLTMKGWRGGDSPEDVWRGKWLRGGEIEVPSGCDGRWRRFAFATDKDENWVARERNSGFAVRSLSLFLSIE
jgi:hypothetical protein